ncbi:MAG: sugar-binding protein, partial [Bacteroidota bacterium]
MKKTFLSVVALVSMMQHAISQEIAIARPLDEISLDGSFKDWPETVNWYRMEHFFGNDDESNEDFSAQFAVSYQEKQQLLHIAIEVLDDDFIGDNGQRHTTQDHMLLYVDALHNIQGGSPLFYVASDRVLEVHHKPGTYRTENHFLTLDKAKVARKRMGNRIQYEWEIQMEGQIKVNNTLGLDFMMIDHDQSSSNETLLLWKDGFGKSFGSQKLGDVVLLGSQTQTGKISGSIDMEKLDPLERINSIDLVSKEHPNLWVKTMVDTTGHFQAILPIGQYKVSPNRYFTSPMYSSGFNQNTHKLSYRELQTFMVLPDTTISVSGIIVTK